MSNSPRRDAILTFITEHINRTGYAPSIREIQAALSIPSSSSVAGHLRKLELRGKIARAEGKARAIRLVPQQP